MELQKTKDIIKEYGKNAKDAGSSSVQIAILTQRIKHLTLHLKDNKKDHHSKYGMEKMVNKRRKLLKYLNRTSHQEYLELIKKLGLRK